MSRQSQYHVFSLPKELLDTLVPRNILNQPPSPPRPSSPPADPVARLPTGARACNVCLGATFADVDQQRIHFRSDWHRYNVKIRLHGSNPVSEAEFAKLVDDLDESISGSGSSDDESDEDSDAVTALVGKTRKLAVARSSSPDAPTSSGPVTPVVWFHSPPSTQIGVYKVLFPSSLPATSYLDELKAMQNPVPEGRKWALFMTAGGHFAGAIVRVSKPEGSDEVELTRKGKPKKPVPDIEMLRHKTFHRYTTRRKQGGSQSLNDNSKSKAVSAGAMLRRYGEQALRDDIQNLLQDWSEELSECERIYIRASVSNRRIFLDYDGAVLTKSDDRLRTFPFPTRRPTQSELSRCLLELTRVKISHLTEEALRAQDEAYLASIQPKARPVPQTTSLVPSPSTEPEKPKLTPEEQTLSTKWQKLLELTSKGRLDALKQFWIREGASLGGVDARIPYFVATGFGIGPGGTLLQIASRTGQEDVVRWLLEDLRADPTIDVPSTSSYDPVEPGDDTTNPVVEPPGSRRTAYDIAANKPVRNVFRRSAAQYPDWWDWLGVARVQSVLTKEMEEGRGEKNKARRKGLKDKIKEREAKEKEKEVVVEAEPVIEPVKKQRFQKEDGPRKLGGGSGSSEGVSGLTPEMRAKIERERRARAAEARMKSLGGGR
ncbi:ANKZF1/VMS1 family protein [Abortiporus biennis]